VQGLSSAPWFKCVHFLLKILVDSDFSSRRYGAEFSIPGFPDLLVIMWLENLMSGNA